jgi:hypothetical protein
MPINDYGWLQKLNPNNHMEVYCILILKIHFNITVQGSEWKFLGFTETKSIIMFIQSYHCNPNATTYSSGTS